MKNIRVGEKAPEFSLPNQEGKILSSGDFLGKRAMVLFFYPADESPICTKEACSFRDAYEAFLDAGAEVMGVSSDSEGSHLKFASHHRLPFPLLSDAGGRLRRAFGVSKSLALIPGRVTYVIDKKGIVRHLFSSQLDAEKHVAEALSVLARLDKKD